MIRGCDLCAQDNDGYTAAHYAVERDDAEMLKALTMPFSSQVKSFAEHQVKNVYEKGIQALALRSHQGLTVFMLACYHGSLKCVEYLRTLNINDAHQKVRMQRVGLSGQNQKPSLVLSLGSVRRHMFALCSGTSQCHARRIAASEVSSRCERRRSVTTQCSRCLSIQSGRCGAGRSKQCRCYRTMPSVTFCSPSLSTTTEKYQTQTILIGRSTVGFDSSSCDRWSQSTSSSRKSSTLCSIGISIEQSRWAARCPRELSTSNAVSIEWCPGSRNLCT